MTDDASRIKKIMEIVEKMQRHGTVYDRLPPEVLTRPRKFADKQPKPVNHLSIDLTRTYGIIDD